MPDDARTVDVHIPAALADRLGGPGPGLDRRALEALAVAAYQAGDLTAFELRQVLGIATRYELDGFLKARGVDDGTQAGLGQSEDERKAADDLVARFRAFRAGKTLGGLSLKELIAEGRR